MPKSKKNSQRPGKTPAKPTIADQFDPFIDYDPRNELPISEQKDRLNTYVEDRNEPKPPPSTILSNVKFNPPVRPTTKVDIDHLRGATGSGVKSEDTKPTCNWLKMTKRENNSIPKPFGTVAEEIRKVNDGDNNGNNNVEIQEPTTSTSIYNSSQQPQSSRQPISISTILNERKLKPNPNNYSNDFPPLSSSSSTTKFKDVQVKATKKSNTTNINIKQEPKPSSPSSSAADKVELSNIESKMSNINIASSDEVENDDLKKVTFEEPTTFLSNRIGKEVNIVMLNVKSPFDFMVKAAEIDDIKKLEELEKEMFQFYKKETQSLAEEICVLGFFTWCPTNDSQKKAKRVHVREKIDDSRVKVHLIDHGADIVVQIQEIYTLFNKFTEVPRMCVKAKSPIHCELFFGFGTTEKEILTHFTKEQLADFCSYENETGISICARESFKNTIINDDLEIDETGFIVEFVD